MKAVREEEVTLLTQSFKSLQSFKKTISTVDLSKYLSATYMYMSMAIFVCMFVFLYVALLPK